MENAYSFSVATYENFRKYLLIHQIIYFVDDLRSLCLIKKLQQ